MEGAVRYALQIRFRGQTRWAATARLRKPTVRVFAPAGKDYEYHIRSICDNGESEYGELHELTTPPNGIITPAQTRNGDDFEPDIVLALPAAKLEIAPNPVNNYLQLTYPVYAKNTYLSIYAANGQEVLQQVLPIGTFTKTIDLQDLSNGLYILNIYENGERVASEKIVKQ